MFRICDPFDRKGWTFIVSLVEFENCVSVYASAVQKAFHACQVTVSLFPVRVRKMARNQEYALPSVQYVNTTTMMATPRPIVLFFFFVLLLTLAHGRHWIVRSAVFSPHDKRPRGTFLPRFTISHPRMRIRGGQDEETDNAVLEPTTAAAEEEEGVSPNLITNTTSLEDEEATGLLEQEEAMEEFQVDSEDEEEAYYHSDSDIENDVELKLVDSEDYEQDEAEEVENEDEAIDVIYETVVDLSKRTSILARKASKVTAIWVKQWSLDLYRACRRAIDAGRLELEEGGDDVWLIVELSEEEEESRFQAAHKKALRLSKRCFKTVTQMTIAFWTMDDDDILLDEEKEENVFKLPNISFFSKFKLHKEYQEENQDNTVQEEENVAEKVRAKCVGGDDSSPTKRRHHHRRRRSSRNDKTATTTDVDMTSDTTTVTVIPKIAKGRKLWTNVAVGITSIVLWQQVGGQALLAKGMHIMARHKLQTRSDKGSLQPDKNQSNT
jgi:hypothetical protein